MKRRHLTLAALAAASLLTLSACGDSDSDGAATPAASSTVAEDAAAVKLLPKDVADAGTLVIGTDATYAPNEYKDRDGKPIGWEIDLADAMAAKLGLATDYKVATFDNILPAITGGKYDLGVSSFFDTAVREKQVDMVGYYQAGVQWAVPAGSDVSPENGCGIKLAVQNGTVEALEDGPARSDECVKAGEKPIELLGYDSQVDVTAAVTLGRADAMVADSPVTQYAVAKSKGKLDTAGDVYQTVYYAIPMVKGSELVPAVKAALESLQADGTYDDILKKWGVEGGAIDQITLNQATADAEAGGE